MSRRLNVCLYLASNKSPPPPGQRGWHIVFPGARPIGVALSTRKKKGKWWEMFSYSRMPLRMVQMKEYSFSYNTLHGEVAFDLSKACNRVSICCYGAWHRSPYTVWSTSLWWCWKTGRRYLACYLRWSRPEGSFRDPQTYPTFQPLNQSDRRVSRLPLLPVVAVKSTAHLRLGCSKLQVGCCESIPCELYVVLEGLKNEHQKRKKKFDRQFGRLY